MGQPVLSAPDVSSHAGGHWFESSSLHQNLGNQAFPRFFLVSPGISERLIFEIFLRIRGSGTWRKTARHAGGKTVPAFKNSGVVTSRNSQMAKHSGFPFRWCNAHFARTKRPMPLDKTPVLSTIPEHFGMCFR